MQSCRRFCTEVKLKPTFKEKWKLYWSNLFRDYSEVAKDVGKDVRQKPIKALTISTFTGFLYYCFKTNPDEKSFLDCFIDNNNDIIQVADTLQNPETKQHWIHIHNCINTGLIRRTSLGFISFMWVDNHNKECKSFKCMCTYLKPEFRSFRDRILDIGFLNKWWILENKFRDYDVN